MTPWSLAELGHGAHDYSPDRSGEEKEAAKAAASVGSSLVIGVGHGGGAADDQVLSEELCSWLKAPWRGLSHGLLVLRMEE